MNRKSLIIALVLLLIGVVGIWFWKQQNTSSFVKNNEVLIGAVLPLSGEVASYGTDSKDGIELAIEIANKSQNQFHFSVNYQDSKGEPKTAVTILEQLFATSKPTAIIGENISSSTASMIPVASKNKTVLISPSASAPNLSGISQYFFRVFPSDIEEGAFIANAVAKGTAKAKVCIIFVNNDYGNGLKDVFQKNSASLDLNVLASFGYEKTNTNFKSILTKVKELNPDVIYMPSYYQDGAEILKQAKQLGIKAKFYGCTTHEDPKFIQIAGKSAEGFIYPIATGFDDKSTDSITMNFIQNFKAKFNKEPGLVSALGYDCAQLIIDGVLIKGNNTEAIKSYILDTKNIQGSAGVMNFDRNGDVHKPIILKTVKDGKFSTY